MDTNDLVARRDKIFGTIVHSYIETAIPVGSRAVSIRSRTQLNLSPASIRNIMADLEEAGLITHPHTSAGRIPTDKGYRYYVNLLMHPQEVTAEEVDNIRQEFSDLNIRIDRLAQQVARLLSELTQQTGVTFVRGIKRAAYLPDLVEILEESESDALSAGEQDLFFGTARRMLRQPEFEDIERTRRFFDLIENRDEISQVLYLTDNPSRTVRISIGSENGLQGMEDMTVITKDYCFGETPIGSLGVVGPTRMNYDHVVSVVNHMADYLSEWLTHSDE